MTSRTLVPAASLALWLVACNAARDLDAGLEDRDAFLWDGGVRRNDGAVPTTHEDARPPPLDEDLSPLFGDAGCGAVYQQHDMIPGRHVPRTENIQWATNPPSSGDHDEFFGTYGVHRNRLERRYYVHNLEHGAVVVLYRCDGNCTAVRDRLERFVIGLPQEVACVGRGVRRRIVLTPDPELDSPVAAASWGWTYRAGCVDEDSLEAFVRRRTGFGPEDTCEDGIIGDGF